MAESNKRKKWLLPTLALLVLAVAGLIFRWLFPPFEPPVLPLPNGYDDLLRAAEMLAPRTGFYREMGEEELAAIVAENGPAHQLAREALQKECMVVVNWSADQADLEQHTEQCSSLRGLARGFAAAARHASTHDQTDEAVRCGLDIAALAPAVARGGLVIDREMAKAVYYNALHSLRAQVDQLDRDDCDRLLKYLAASSLELEAPSEVIRRDMAFMRQIHGTVQMMMMRGVARAQSQQMLARMEESEKRIETLNLLLQTHLALRAFQLDNNAWPETLDDLTPKYLDDVPQDSFGAASLKYRLEADGYLLYSVGPDGVDDGGVESTNGMTGDLLLEVSD